MKLKHYAQLLGCILFFVPRVIWHNKPVGSGHLVFQKLEPCSFTNVSCPLIGESYINFGVIGIIIAALLLGVFTDSIDNKYWNDKANISFLKIIYPFIMFMYFFILRGDLMSSGAYTISLVLIGYVMYKFMFGKIKI